MPFHSLRFKTSLFVALIMVFVLCVFSGTFIITERQKGSADILQNGRTLAEFSAPSIYSDYVQLYTHPDGFEAYENRVKPILDLNHDIVGITLLGINGRVLFDSSELSAGRYQGATRSTADANILDDLAQTKTTHRSVTLADGEPGIAIVVPLKESGIGHVVSVRYLVSYASLSARTASIVIATAWLAIPLMVVVILVAIWFAVSLTRPIIKLTQVAEEIRGGNFEIKTNATAKDEIGRLGRAFDHMTTQLRQTYGELNESLKKVTQRTDELTEEHARFTASIDSLPLGFMMTDATGVIVLTNAAMTNMINNARNGKTSQLQTQLIDHAHGCLASKQSTVIPELSENGKIYRVFLSPVLVDKASGPIAIGTAILTEDITEERIMTRSKEEFFSIASHELRTPLTAIRGNTNMILNYFANTIKDPALKEMVTDIHGSSVRLIKIVNDFLDASRLEQGKMEFTPVAFPLGDVVKATVDEIAVIAGAKGVSLKIDKTIAGLPALWADQNKTKQVLYNLIGNALKFVEKGSIVIGAEIDNKLAKILVTDTGKGMTPEEQQILFHKFQQATSSILTRDDTRGTGLGLYISRLLVEQMGGHIQLERSEVGKGSTFSFTIPIATNKQASQKEDIGQA